MFLTLTDYNSLFKNFWLVSVKTRNNFIIKRNPALLNQSLCFTVALCKTAFYDKRNYSYAVFLKIILRNFNGRHIFTVATPAKKCFCCRLSLIRFFFSMNKFGKRISKQFLLFINS